MKNGGVFFASIADDFICAIAHASNAFEGPIAPPLHRSSVQRAAMQSEKKTKNRPRSKLNTGVLLCGQLCVLRKCSKIKNETY